MLFLSFWAVWVWAQGFDWKRYKMWNMKSISAALQLKDHVLEKNINYREFYSGGM